MKWTESTDDNPLVLTLTDANGDVVLGQIVKDNNGDVWNVFDYHDGPMKNLGSFSKEEAKRTLEAAVMIQKAAKAKR